MARGQTRFLYAFSLWTAAALGVTIEDSIALTRELAAIGVDVIDCSSGGSCTPYEHQRAIHQVPYAKRIRTETGVTTMAVSMIVDPRQADSIVAENCADIVAPGREALHDPNFPWLNARQSQLNRMGP